MPSYHLFCRFYYDLMGDCSAPQHMSSNSLENITQKAKTLLELACGTGSVLKHLRRKYEVSGLDISKERIFS